jgi:hypothetical protein
MWQAEGVGLAYVNPATWALAMSLAILAGVWTFFAFRAGRKAATVRGVGLVLLPVGLLLTGTLTLALRILDAVSLWATRLVFSPSVWVGAVLVLIALALILGGRALGRRLGEEPVRRSMKVSPPAAKQLGRGASGSSPAATGDPDLDEIEDLLRKRGIS